MSIREVEELIAGIEVLGDLSPGQRAVIAGCARNAAFADGEVLMSEGEDAVSFFALRRGTVAIELAAPAGPPLVIETLEAGDLVGWSWLFEPYRNQFDVRAVGDVGALVFDGGCLRGKCDADHELGYELMRRFAGLISGRLQATRLRLLDLYGGTRAGGSG